MAPSFITAVAIFGLAQVFCACCLQLPLNCFNFRHLFATDEHKANYEAANNAIQVDRERAKLTQGLVFITMDLQQTMPLSKLTTSKAFYLRQMWFYNFGVHIITSTGKKRLFCTWTEDLAFRGSAETCSSLLRCIELYKYVNEDHLLIWSDSCAGQNKNFSMICLYQYLILKGHVKCIDHKFPEVGHTYLDSDRDFGRIEKLLRKHDKIYLPEQYREIIKEAGRRNTVIDMTQDFRKIEDLPKKVKLINRKKNEDKQVVRFRDGISMDEYGSYLYKESYNETEPFKRVNILRSTKNEEPPNIETLGRVGGKYGELSAEKKQNLRDQMKFIPDIHHFFYESVLQ